MFHICAYIYVTGFLLMSLLMASYYIITRAVNSVGEPVWKLVFTALVWPAVIAVLIYQWIEKVFCGPKWKW